MAKSTKTDQSRVRKLDYKSKKKVARTTYILPGGFKIFNKAIKHIWKNKRLFGLLMLIQIILYVVLVKGFASNFQLGQARDTLEAAVGDRLGTIGTASALVGVMIGSSAQASGEAAVYQIILIVIFSLCYIWALRQTYEVKSVPNIKVKQVFYNSMAPLIQYLLVFIVIFLQLLPAVAGVAVYSLALSSGIAVNTFEQILWLILALVLVAWSLFMVSSSIFAAYIVTLPKLTPMIALRKSRALVKFRRFLVVRKVALLPVILIAITAVIFIPLVLYLPVVAEILFVIYIVKLLLISHTYLYILYKEMIKND